ncbi:Nuclear transcription factor Y subunit beta [Ceratocystis platani]|uniref:Nuclear transcription factor Y subunit beta n=2 Tax=Ceratocystis TaxID=5157 RepID=A0A0F8B4B5_CERFI|nr:Nuclear transcription factor Y subunit beta [Ceratocystis platani]
MSDSPQSQTQNQNQSLPPPEAEHAVHDAEVDEQMNEGQEHPGAGLGFDFEVKEQDRWLPIANEPSLCTIYFRVKDASIMQCLALLVLQKYSSHCPCYMLAMPDNSFPINAACQKPTNAVNQGQILDNNNGNKREQVLHKASTSKIPQKAPPAKSQAKSPRHSAKMDEVDANIRNFAPVARIMKNALPENAKIAKEAKECMQECVSEFISFITSEASEKCHQEKRKTVNGEDIIFAMTSLGFENYAEALKIYLAKYRDTQTPRDPPPRTASQEFANSSTANLPEFDSAAGNAQPAFSTAENTESSTDPSFPYPTGTSGTTGEPSF